MSIKHYLSAAAALVLMAACSEYDPGMSGEVVNYTDDELATIQEYAKNFKEHFGGIDPNHTWGFGEKGSEDEMSTRTINVNRNDWVLRTENPWYLDDGITVKKDENGNDMRKIEWITNPAEFGQNAADIVIPGFPSIVDGKYHTEEGVFNSIDDIEAAELRSIHPIGDVCKEEILQVSQWFRTHRNPTSIEFDYSAIFFQEISQDVDRVVSGSTKSEIEANYDEAAWDAAYDESDGNNQGGTAQYNMDYLMVKGATSEWEHINNYNNYSSDFDENGKYISNHISEANPNSTEQELSNRKIKYWTTNGGKAVDFGYHGSYDDNNWTTYNWVVCKVPYTVVVDGVAKTFEGTYLAFDYEMDKTGIGGGKVNRDGFYSNWIIKLAPGVEIPNPDHDWYRIMCEDLGNTYDYDFNDLVYDVYYTGEASPYTAHIKVQAAGGTYPIFIGQHDADHEAHGLLGYADKYNAETGLYQPVNVGTGCDNGTAEEFTLSVNTTNPDDILIYVEKPGTKNAREKNDFSLPKVHEASDAPQKICIPGNKTRWTLENRNIEWAYPNFTNWVLLQTDIYNFGKSSDWTKTGVQTNHLFY